MGQIYPLLNIKTTHGVRPPEPHNNLKNQGTLSEELKKVRNATFNRVFDDPDSGSETANSKQNGIKNEGWKRARVSRLIEKFEINMKSVQALNFKSHYISQAPISHQASTAMVKSPLPKATEPSNEGEGVYISSLRLRVKEDTKWGEGRVVAGLRKIFENNKSPEASSPQVKLVRKVSAEQSLPPKIGQGALLTAFLQGMLLPQSPPPAVLDDAGKEELDILNELLPPKPLVRRDSGYTSSDDVSSNDAVQKKLF